MFFSRIKDFFRIYSLAVLVTLLLLGLSFIVFLESYRRVEERNNTLFAIRTEAAKTAIEKRMLDYVQILKGAQALFAVSDTVTHYEWKKFFKALAIEENYPGILGLGYAHVLDSGEVNAFEERVRANGFPEFKVWPENSRSLYTTIIYLEPFNIRNKRAFGYDMFADSIRHKAMARARDTGNPALSSMVRLVQETDVAAQNGFLLYMPLYASNSVPNSLKRRRSLLQGYVYAPFRVNDLMKGILGRRFQDLEIEIYDGTQIIPERLLYKSQISPEQVGSKRKDLLSIIPLRIAGHTWQLYINPAPGFGEDYTFPWFILGGGVLFSALMFIIMYSLINIKRSTYLRQLITDNATAALVILDKNDNCNFINPAAESLLGYSLDELQLNTFHQMVHYKYPDGTPYPPHECPIIKSLAEIGSIYKLESVLFHKDGSPVVVNINAQPIYERGRVVAHLLEIRDVRSEKDAEDALRLKNRNLQTLNSIAENLLAELELSKLIQFVIDSCTELTGAQFGAYLNNTFDASGEAMRVHSFSGADPMAFDNLNIPRADQLFLTTLLDKSIVRSDDLTTDERYGKNNLLGILPEESLPVKSYLAVPVISRSGEVLGGLFFFHSGIGVFSKNTENIVKGIAAQAAIAIDNSRLFEAISQKNSELLKINNDLDSFVYTASHDLKAPVLNIEGLVYALSNAIEKNKPERIRLILDNIQLSITKFKETIQSLTEVAKTNKNLDESLDVINMPELLNNVLFSINDMVQQSGAIVTLDLQEQEVKFSSANMRSLLHNLLTNAIKYSSADRTPHISISCKRKENSVELKITDNGIGIDPAYLPKLYTMFSRYHTHVEGTGIGLYLVKRIVENNGGSIAVESSVGEGTTFIINLPVY